MEKLSASSKESSTLATRRKKVCHSETKYVAHLDVFTFALVQVIIDADKSDGCRENGKETDCGQVLKASFSFLLACTVSLPFHPFAEV
jgi:hypothetical protein